MALHISDEDRAASVERVRQWAAMTYEERQAYSKEQEALRQARRKEQAEAYAAWLKEQRKENEPRRQAFLKELCDLLTKYGADISANVGEGSDTHGIYDESIGIYLNVSDGKRGGSIPAIEVPGWSLSPSDLK